VANLELPSRVLPRPLAATIPGIELALVVGLLSPWRPAFLLAANGSLVLLAVYWALIARGLTITPRPSCDCFGEVGNHVITGRTLLRNTVLVGAAIASVALAASGRTVWSLLGGAARGDWLWLGLAAMACITVGLVVGRSGADPSRDVPDLNAFATSPQTEDGDYVRQPIPSALLHDPQSGPVTLRELAARRAQLLVFVNCYCASTREAAASIEGWRARLPAVGVRLVFSVPIPQSQPLPTGTLLDHRGLASTVLGLAGSPCAVLLGADGALAGGPVDGMDELRTFVDDIEETLRDAHVTTVGTTAPTPVEEPRVTSGR
jgi:hypothetical protein